MRSGLPEREIEIEAGLAPLRDRYEVDVVGEGAPRETVLERVPGARAIVRAGRRAHSLLMHAASGRPAKISR